MCEHKKLDPIESPANGVDYYHSNSRQSYQVYRCRDCQHIIGIRHQWDSGTGCDDYSNDFGVIDPATVVRHY